MNFVALKVDRKIGIIVPFLFVHNLWTQRKRGPIQGGLTLSLQDANLGTKRRASYLELAQTNMKLVEIKSSRGQTHGAGYRDYCLQC